MLNSKMPVLFISHGGGPWPWIPDMRTAFSITENALAKLGKTYSPVAILMISGHWEEKEFTVSTGAHPGMIYDYSGFPPDTYQIKYPAPGSQSLALEVKELLEGHGVRVATDPHHGFDHGTFVPLYCMYPEANVPVVQLSMKSNYSPEEHFRIGTYLHSLREKNILVIGSGLTYHNLRKMFAGGAEGHDVKFTRWLTEILKAPQHERLEKLKNWSSAPGARESHPREDHLVPLFVIAGAAGEDSGQQIFLDKVFNVEMASYQFG